ncbi:MAG: histidinol-phosphate transaminase [Clostridia bacterium]|nr:histidinol-phosphate transaminase [Clostridia bacterium]
MSPYFSQRYQDLKAYTPGEQPKQRKYIKLNTNESPFPPAPGVRERVAEEVQRLNLYSDPESSLLRQKLAEGLGIGAENLIMTNGSDEALNYAFMAFCDEDRPAVFPDITYGFYPVFARINRLPFQEIPLTADFRIDPRDYDGIPGTLFLANPNAPTGLALGLEVIEDLLKRRKEHILVVDEAYVDFGGESAVKLIHRYENLIVTRTFSKSRSLAGLRLGFAAAAPERIQEMKTMQYSTNPYNVDRLAQAAGIACLEADEYNLENVKKVCETRSWTQARLEEMGFEMTDSRTNFLFVRHSAFPGSRLRDALREKGILIRWFDQERIRDWSRITIGAQEEMETLVHAVQQLLEE